MQKEELEKKYAEELDKVYSGDNSKRDSGMPIFEGAVITLVAPEKEDEPFFIKESNYSRWRTKEGHLLSVSQTGRRGNGLGLEGATDRERNAKLAALVAAAGTDGVQISVTKVKQKKSLFRGEESLNNYLFFEAV